MVAFRQGAEPASLKRQRTIEQRHGETRSDPSGKATQVKQVPTNAVQGYQCQLAGVFDNRYWQ